MEVNQICRCGLLERSSARCHSRCGQRATACPLARALTCVTPSVELRAMVGSAPRVRLVERTPEP